MSKNMCDNRSPLRLSYTNLTRVTKIFTDLTRKLPEKGFCDLGIPNI